MMAKESLFDHGSLAGDDRNFREQMADLSVPIEPFHGSSGSGQPARTQQKPESRSGPKLDVSDVTWVRKTVRSSLHLGEKISVNKYSIGIGEIAVAKMERAVEEEIDKLGFGVKPHNNGLVLVIAVNDPMGFDVKKSKGKSGSITVASKTVIDKLMAAGIRYGRYRLDRQHGSLWVAVWEGEADCD